MSTNAAVEQKNIEILGGILEAVNTRNYDIIDRIMAPDFQDHHPGLSISITSREDYKRALAYMHETMDMRAELDFSFAQNDKVVTHVTLMGIHKEPFLGIPPTNRPVRWTTMEIYRLQDGLIRERWALDDLYGLMRQIGALNPPPGAG